MDTTMTAEDVDQATATARWPEGGAASLPPELIKLVASHLAEAAGCPSADVLAARATCTAWAIALQPAITQLHVRSTLPLPPAPNDEAAAAPAPRAAATSLPRLLAAALQRLTYVTRVIVDCGGGDGGDKDALLDALLRVVGAQPAVTEVAVRQGSVSSSAGSTASGLQAGVLQHLRHVRVLRLAVVGWQLQDIWQHISALAAAADSDSSSSQGCLLHTLEISLPAQPLPGLGCTQACQLPPPSQLPRSICRLSTPLPGQCAADGSVLTSLPASHEAYVRGLAAGLPGLTALELGCTARGCAYEGGEHALLAFPRLQELRVHVGDRFRSFTSDRERHAAAHHLHQLLAMASRVSALHLHLDWR